MKKYIKNILSIAIMILVICTLFLVINNYINIFEPFKIQTNNIIIKGNNFITNDEILMPLKDLINNKNSININTNQIKSKLLTNINIESVEVYKVAPSFIMIELIEREFVAKINEGDIIYYIDTNAQKFRPRNKEIEKRINSFYNPIPIINNNNKETHYKDIVEMLNLISKNLSKIFADLEEIRYDNAKIELSCYSGDSTIQLSHNNYINNIKSLIGFIQQIENENSTNFSINYYDYINTLVDEQIIIRDKTEIIVDDHITEDKIN